MSDAAMRGRGPRYRQIASDLMGRIESGRFRPGDVLPNEIDLAEIFGVSRHTIREALRRLSEAGLVERRQGAGTMVLPAPGPRRFAQSLGSIADVMQYAHDTEFRLTGLETIRADRRLAELLKCHRGRKWLRVIGLRFEKGGTRPICLTRAYVASAYAAIEEALRGPVTSIAEEITARFGVEVATIAQTVSAASLTEDEARLLDVPADLSALRTVRRFLGADGQVLHVSDSLHPGDRFQLEMTFSRDAG